MKVEKRKRWKSKQKCLLSEMMKGEEYKRRNKKIKKQIEKI